MTPFLSQFQPVSFGRRNQATFPVTSVFSVAKHKHAPRHSVTTRILPLGRGDVASRTDLATEITEGTESHER